MMIGLFHGDVIDFYFCFIMFALWNQNTCLVPLIEKLVRLVVNMQNVSELCSRWNENLSMIYELRSVPSDSKRIWSMNL